MIDKVEIFQRIGEIIAELKGQYNYLSENFESINELEIDLFIANASFLTDHAEIFKKLNERGNKQNKVDETHKKPAKTLNLAETHSDRGSQILASELGKDERGFDFEKKTIEELYDRKFSPEEQEIINKKLAKPDLKGVQMDPEPTMVEHKQPKIASIKSEAIATDLNVEMPDVSSKKSVEPTVNDLISSQRSYNTLGTELNKQPIKDLKTGISLNDKLLFIKELFNGYSLAYSEAIEILNRFDSFDLAESFLNTNYFEKNNWTANSITVEKFYTILHRRYAK